MASYWEADEASLALRLYLASATGELAKPPAAAPAAKAKAATAPAKGKGGGGGGGGAAAAGGAAVGGAAEVILGEDGKPLSKSALKKLAKGKGKDKKPKDKNFGKVDPEKAAKKAAEKAAKAKAKADALAAEEALVVDTPHGDKKIMTDTMASAYKPEMVEKAWQEWWEKSGFYSADAEAGKAAGEEGRFVIVIPPPNVTGSLHLGHALTAAIEDTLTRWHRMKGDVTLYVPGTDHAGIATQSIVEKMLVRDQGINRHDLGREKFLEKVWEWKDQYGSRICRQIRELGSSVDWSREAFTMDDKCSKAVVEAFCRFHEDGILFRDKRLINWSCKLKSAISDIEVDHEDIEGGVMRSVPGHTKQDKYQFGMFTEFAYKVSGSDEEIIVATTRLETMLGDTAVAVHPEDPRYKHLHGKFVDHPFHDRKIPIILDDVLVDMNLGTGAVKITPAHDPNDYECGIRHKLPFITIFTPDGIVNSEGAQFEGMMRYDARVAVEEALKEVGLLKDKYPKPMKLGFCSRSGDVIEPMIMPQWFVDCDNMAKRAMDAVKDGELRILPEMHVSTWNHWLSNSRPWCVSRQLWWGHRIPAYFACTKAEEGVIDQNANDHKNRWIVARSEPVARTKAAALLGVPESEVVLNQDEDVLDTWFSSGLFPFSVMGWPDQTADLSGFFPTSLLETGLDILFFWVARMVMMSLQLTDKLPFKDVYLHAMVRDKEGRKMSKSLGNVIDPLEVIHGCTLDTLYAKLQSGNLASKEVAKAEAAFKADFEADGGIPACGADALRIGLLAYTVQGRDINLDIKRVVGYRSFCNKLWQGTRFLLGCFGEFMPTDIMRSTILDVASTRDRFILSKLNTCIRETTQCLTEYEFGKSVQVLQSFFVGTLCDVYLELIKPVVHNKDDAVGANQAKATLWLCLDSFLKLLHPICPFVTEELWQRLPGRGSLAGEAESIMIAGWPVADPSWDNTAAEDSTALVLDCIGAARSLRHENKLKDKVPADFFIACSSQDSTDSITAQIADFTTLSTAKTVTMLVAPAEPPMKCSLKIVTDSVKVYVNCAGMVDKSSEIAKCNKEIKMLTPLIKKLEAKMANPKYLETAPPATVDKDRSKLREYAGKKEEAEKTLKSLQ